MSIVCGFSVQRVSPKSNREVESPAVLSRGVLAVGFPQTQLEFRNSGFLQPLLSGLSYWGPNLAGQLRSCQRLGYSMGNVLTTRLMGFTANMHRLAFALLLLFVLSASLGCQKDPETGSGRLGEETNVVTDMNIQTEK